jgi:large subunit ribosomal protein L4
MVQGSTKKPFRQKGTGRARQGTIRAPQMRGGATVFGPQVRDHSFSLPKKVRQLGLKVALSSKLRAGQVVIVDDIKLKDAKTSKFAALVKKNGWESALFIGGDAVNQDLMRASQNIVGFDVLPQQGANVYSILKRQTLILSKDAVHHLEARLK